MPVSCSFLLKVPARLHALSADSVLPARKVYGFRCGRKIGIGCDLPFTYVVKLINYE